MLNKNLPIHETEGAELLLKEIEDFIANHKMAQTRFGLLALNDERFVGKLRDGRHIWVSTMVKVRAWMDGFDKGVASEKARA